MDIWLPAATDLANNCVWVTKVTLKLGMSSHQATLVLLHLQGHLTRLSCVVCLNGKLAKGRYKFAEKKNTSLWQRSASILHSGSVPFTSADILFHTCRA